MGRCNFLSPIMFLIFLRDSTGFNLWLLTVLDFTTLIMIQWQHDEKRQIVNSIAGSISFVMYAWFGLGNSATGRRRM